MNKIKIFEQIKESPTGLFNSLIGKRLEMLRSTAIDNLKNANFDAYGRLLLVLESEEVLEFKTTTRLIINVEYNITEIQKADPIENIDELKEYIISQPFFLKKVLIYGETVTFVDTYGDFAYERLKDKSVDKENIICINTEDIIVFESNSHQKFMLRTLQSPYFEAIFEEDRIKDIIENWSSLYLIKKEVRYKLKRVIE